MDRILRFATDAPIIFVLVIVAVFYLLMTITFMVGMLAGENAELQQVIQAVATSAVALAFAFILQRLGWAENTGLTRFGGWQVWRPILIPLIYGVATAVYAYTGDFRFDLSKPGLLCAIGLNMLAVGLVEEIVFRGVVQCALIRHWNNTISQLLGSIIFGALIFGSSHMIWAIFGKPVPQTALQSLSAFLAGIYYGLFVLSTGSLWPAILFHGLVNAAVNIKIVGLPGYHESVQSGLKMVLFDIPVVIYALYLFWTKQ